MVDIPPVERDLAPQGKLRGGIKCMMSIDDASDQIGSGQGRPLGQQSSYFTLSNGGWFATPEPKYGLGIGEGSPTPDIALLHYRILEPKTLEARGDHRLTEEGFGNVRVEVALDLKNPDHSTVVNECHVGHMGSPRLVREVVDGEGLLGELFHGLTYIQEPEDLGLKPGLPVHP